jgi:geranylgeranyl pyrophosphate synthase
MSASAAERIDVAARADREAVERRLDELVGALTGAHAPMQEAIRYAVLGGGKRVRPLLCLWTHDAVSGHHRPAALDAGCAVECVHAYSLVHDDLPCMDDDDVRRGKPSAHRRFGEATAVLLGDGLQALAFEILATLPERHAGVTADVTLSAVAALASAAGTRGLITGQALDLAPPARNLEAVSRIHEHKTARLIAAAMEIGAVVAGAGGDERGRALEAGLLAGRAFQIVDDLLDVEGRPETLGKTPGKDAKGGKLTYPAVAGPAAARKEARDLARRARALLPTGAAEAPLGLLIDFMVERSA